MHILILFAYNLMMGYPKKKIEKIIQESTFNKKKKKKKAGLKFNPGLALTGVRTTGPSLISKTFVSTCWKNVLKCGNLWIFSRIYQK